MSKPRIAAWIAGSALLLSSGVALAQEAQPEDPTVEETELVESPVLDEGAGEVEVEVDEDLDNEDGDEPDEQLVEAAEAEGVDDTNEDGEENHGSVVSEAAQNHEFDEACGNHGAYVSEVARGGDPADPECAKEAVEAEAGADESTTAAPGKSGDSKGKAKASGGKAAKRGK